MWLLDSKKSVGQKSLRDGFEASERRARLTQGGLVAYVLEQNVECLQ